MATTNKANFTKGYLNDLPVPDKGKRAYYYDTKTQGLGICITPANKKRLLSIEKSTGDQSV